MIFTGDFSQLEPVNGIPLYREPNFAPWHAWINCFVELTGQHRFKNDPEFGRVMKQIREGCPTAEDIAYLNTRIINGDHPNAPMMEDVPYDVVYAVYKNTDRVATNNGIFAEHIKRTHSTDKTASIPKHTIVIRSDEMTWKTSKNAFSCTCTTYGMDAVQGYQNHHWRQKQEVCGSFPEIVQGNSVDVHTEHGCSEWIG